MTSWIVSVVFAVACMVPGGAFANKLDPMSHEYMDLVEEVAQCAATEAIVSGRTDFLQEYEPAKQSETLLKIFAEDSRAYELQFELGPEYGTAFLRTHHALITYALRTMSRFERAANYPQGHRKLIERRWNESVAFGAGYHAYASVGDLAKTLKKCRETYIFLRNAIGK